MSKVNVDVKIARKELELNREVRRLHQNQQSLDGYDANAGDWWQERVHLNWVCAVIESKDRIEKIKSRLKRLKDGAQGKSRGAP